MLALLAEVKAVTATDPWLQYGAFGAFIALIFYFVRWGIPNALNSHKEIVTQITEDTKVAIAKSVDDNKEAIGKLATEHKDTVKQLVCSFEKENEMCRAERIANSALMLANMDKERLARDDNAEKERLSRHDLTNQFQSAIKDLTVGNKT